MSKIDFKPWQLVYVDVEWVERAFIGELVSFPIPGKGVAGSIMVRRIPGNPGTLEEVEIERVTPVEPGAYFVHYARVWGNRKYFPRDMLRSDRCEPVNFKLIGDAAVLLPGEPQDSTLIVAQVVRRRTSTFTFGRWQSFGWGVEDLSTEGPFIQEEV